MSFQHSNLMAAAMVLFMSCVFQSPQLLAQERTTVIVAGAGAVYNLPIGTLHNRFLGAVGAMAWAGVEVSPRLTWTGKFEYFELTTLNTDALRKTVTIGQGVSAVRYSVPLPKLTMKLTAAALAAEARLTLFGGGQLQSHAVAGFGFVNWVYTRGAYSDSLFVQTTSTGLPVKAADLAVPSNRQEDWNGAFSLGLEVSVHVAGPVWLAAGADYKLIVGELWQALDLDLENVAGMQFVSLRAGLRAEL